MLVSDFDFHLPEELIAQEALPERSASRMLHLLREAGSFPADHFPAGRFEDRRFADLPGLLRPDDLLVINNSRVFPARLFGRRAGLHSQPVSPRNPATRDFLHGRVEVLLTRQLAPLEWQALVRPGRKVAVGEKIFFEAENARPPSDLSPSEEKPELIAEVIGRGEFGERTLHFEPVPDFFALVEKLGHVPLPPYISRADRPEDRERYQTVYAHAEARGSIAAPTAGLHFTPESLAAIRGRGIEIAEITLHVGLGTFQPVHAKNVEEHKLHRERFWISEAVAAQLNRALEQRRRIVAVGTTTVRTLEYAARQSASLHISAGLGSAPASAKPALAGGPSAPASARPALAGGPGEADIFIYPGFEFRVVGALLTNFHLPKSTLLMLVSAFAGREKVLRAYEHAVAERYRFFSYGDCMFIE